MAKQEILWTTLPNGYVTSPGKLSVSVFVSPRLNAEGDPEQLSTFFPEFEDWPATILGRLTFGAEVRNALSPKLTPLFDKLDSGLWKALLKPDTFVRGHAVKNYKRRIFRSFSPRRTLQHLRDAYRQLAETTGISMPRAPYAANP